MLRGYRKDRRVDCSLCFTYIEFYSFLNIIIDFNSSITEKLDETYYYYYYYVVEYYTQRYSGLKLKFRIARFWPRGLLKPITIISGREVI